MKKFNNIVKPEPVEDEDEGTDSRKKRKVEDISIWERLKDDITSSHPNEISGKLQLVLVLLGKHGKQIPIDSSNIFLRTFFELLRNCVDPSICFLLLCCLKRLSRQSFHFFSSCREQNNTAPTLNRSQSLLTLSLKRAGSMRDVLNETKAIWTSVWSFLLHRIPSWDISLYNLSFEVLESLISNELCNPSQESLWKLPIFEVTHEAASFKSVIQFLYSFLRKNDITTQNNIAQRAKLADWVLKSLTLWGSAKNSEAVNEIDPQLWFYLLRTLSVSGWVNEDFSENHPLPLPDRLISPLYHSTRNLYAQSSDSSDNIEEELRQIELSFSLSSHNFQEDSSISRILNNQVFSFSFNNPSSTTTNHILGKFASELQESLLKSLKECSSSILEEAKSILQNKKRTLAFPVSQMYIPLLKVITISQIVMSFIKAEPLLSLIGRDTNSELFCLVHPVSC